MSQVPLAKVRLIQRLAGFVRWMPSTFLFLTVAFAASATGTLYLVWSETHDGRVWRLYVSSLVPDAETWSAPKMLRSAGNPRFPSAVATRDGALWIACSIDTPDGRRVVVERYPWSQLAH